MRADAKPAHAARTIGQSLFSRGDLNYNHVVKDASDHPASVPVRAPLPRRTKVVFAAVCLLLVLVGLESVSRLLFRLTPNARWQHHHRLVESIGIASLNRILEPDPALFWRVKPGLRNVVVAGRIADSGDLRFSVSTDGDGRRRMPVVDAPRHTILFLGDSSTFGVGVNDEQTFPALIQQRLPGVRCINTGVPGYSAYQGRKLLESLPPNPPPAVVVISFDFNDDSSWDHLGDAEHDRLIAAEQSRLVNRLRFLRLLQQVLPEKPSPEPPQGVSQRPRLTDTEYAEQLRMIIE